MPGLLIGLPRTEHGRNLPRNMHIQVRGWSSIMKDFRNESLGLLQNITHTRGLIFLKPPEVNFIASILLSIYTKATASM